MKLNTTTNPANSNYFNIFVELQKIDSCQSADISGVYLMEYNGGRIKVYCEVEPFEGNKWLVTINVSF